jgi:hypothetical protein
MVKGKILISPHISDVWGGGGGGLRTRKQIGRTVNIRYSYIVNGVEYHGDNISFRLDIITSSNLFDRLSTMYEVNQEVDVYYNPKKPDISVLNP